MDFDFNYLTTEKIGNVTLDYSYYSGEDLYSEGEAEDVLLDIVSKFPESDFDSIIQQRCSWSVMYHLSHIRENVTNWIPLSENDKVLEIGSGCGAITGDLSKRAGSVTCIELSRKRSQINATRHRDASNVNIMVGNFEAIEPNLTEKYDVITLIGVLEYATSYISGNHKHHAMINKLKSHLAPGGRIVIAIENRLGLKYFAGCKEDHTGEYFSGIMGYSDDDNVRTFSKKQLSKLMDECGMKTKYYYPYPDYKLPHTIYSDEVLPKVGELNTNIRNFDADRIVLFDELRAFDSLIEEDVFPQYANSFVVIATVDEPYDNYDNVPIYAKYADGRVEEFRVSTTIVKNRDGFKKVYKSSITTATNAHIKRIAKSYEELTAQYSGIRLTPNKGMLIEGQEPTPLIAGVPSKARDKIEFEYINGITLESHIRELEKNGEYERIESIMKTYVKLLDSNDDAVTFEKTPEFENIFGKRTFKKEYKAMPISNFDVIFSNIMLDSKDLEDGTWTVIDYEWVFDFPIPIPYIIYRALFYQTPYDAEQGFGKYLASKGTDVYSLCGIDIGERMLFEEMEHSFQRYIIGGVASLEVMQVMMPSACISMDRVVNMGSYLRNLDTPKIYYSRSRVFTPDQRMGIIAKVNGGVVSMRIPVEHYLTALRIDPTEYPCIMYIDSIKTVLEDGNKVDSGSVIVNGYAISNRVILYDTDDAQLIIENIPKGAKAVEVSYQITMYDPAFYKETLSLCKEKRKKELQEQSKFSNKLKRKLGIVKSDNLPEGFIRQNYIG